MNADERARAVTALVEEYSDSLYRYAYRLSGKSPDAEDLVQQTFLTAQRKLDQLRDSSKQKAWLFAVVRNTFLKTRRRTVGKTVALENVAEPTAPAGSPPDFTNEELSAALAMLPDDFRLPLILFYFEDLSYREISEALELPMGTVMSRLSRGKAGLRQQLTHESSSRATS